MNQYHKIPSVFKRCPETKKVLHGEWISPEVEELKDCNWLFTEKIDGTNIRVHWNGHSIIYGGRTNKANIPPYLIDKLDEMFNEQIFEQVFGEKEVTLYGEGFGGKIQTGKKDYQDKESFILFDVKIGNFWLDRFAVDKAAKDLGIKSVPILDKCSLKTAINLFKKDHYEELPFTLSKNKIEGLVGILALNYRKRSGERVIVKLLAKDLKWNKGYEVGDKLTYKQEIFLDYVNDGDTVSFDFDGLSGYRKAVVCLKVKTEHIKAWEKFQEEVEKIKVTS